MFVSESINVRFLFLLVQMGETTLFGKSDGANVAMGIESVSSAVTQMLISRALLTAYVQPESALTFFWTVILCVVQGHHQRAKTQYLVWPH